MISGKKRKTKTPRLVTSILTTIPDPDDSFPNTTAFLYRDETPRSTYKKLPSSSTIRSLVQQKQDQACFGSEDQQGFAFTKEEEEEQHKLRLAQRRKRFESRKRVTKTVATSTNSYHDSDTVMDHLDIAFSSSETAKSFNGLSSSSSSSSSSPGLVGLNSNLEKPYLRLTTFADPNHVRPLPVLIKALAHIKNQYLLKEDFEWANDQLKSVRQDLTVQRIRNPFVLEVYETHARMLLEQGDLNEFNQCQTVIRALCGHVETGWDGVKSGTDEQGKGEQPLRQRKECADEFGGYALLYSLVRNSWLELNQTLQQQQEQQNERANNKQDYEGVQSSSYQHALCVVRAVLEDDSVAFFRLYAVAPHMSAYLMDFLVSRVRKASYLRAIASYRPNIGTEQFREWLRFDDLEQTRQFLKHQGAVFLNVSDTAAFWVDCKASFAKLTQPSPMKSNCESRAKKRLKRTLKTSSSSVSNSSEDTK